MKKREISPTELRKVIELREVNATWTEIERQTGVERRAAKRAYEEWVGDKEMEQEKAARFRVAAEAFHEHLDDLIRLANILVNRLGLPYLLDEMEKNTEQFFFELWKQDLLGRYTSPETGEKLYIGDLETYRREQQLLFESLREHTHEKVRWDVLDNRWKKARNDCAKIMPKLRKETSEVVNHFLNQERETNFVQRVMERSREDNLAKKIAKEVVNGIWQLILHEKMDEEISLFEFETVVQSSGQDGLIIVKQGDSNIFIFIGNDDKSLAERVTHICNLVANNLRKDDVIRELYREVGNMKKARDELREMLNPIKLRPIILRTHCNLCPA